jgi:hypothetical protein
MKSKILSFVLIFLAVFVMSSCTKEANPEILNFELGYDNSGVGYLGADLHMDAEFIAEGKIDKVIVEIHHEGDHGKKSVSLILNGEEWGVDTTYTKFSGLKNTKFHEHLEIPLWAELGEYHFHLKVIDMEGNVAEKEAELEIKAPINK